MPANALMIRAKTWTEFRNPHRGDMQEFVKAMFPSWESTAITNRKVFFGRREWRRWWCVRVPHGAVHEWLRPEHVQHEASLLELADGVWTQRGWDGFRFLD